MKISNNSIVSKAQKNQMGARSLSGTEDPQNSARRNKKDKGWNLILTAMHNVKQAMHNSTAPTCIPFINCVQSALRERGRGQSKVSCAFNNYKLNGRRGWI